MSRTIKLPQDTTATTRYFSWLAEPVFNPPRFSRRKQGGIWFIRLWRVRVNFCLANLQG
jgi:hypothetical protein